ncbi:MAG: hypothetical protein HUJ63_03585 [Enterococcus sp.]|nr:hypothetical protein [Enterococcus sp.]
MKLDIYEKKKVVKTYEAESYDLMFGTVEDVMTMFNVDSLKSGSQTEIINMVATILPKCINTVKPLLKDIFDGLTDEELKNVKLKDIVKVLVEVITFAFEQISVGIDPKN